MKKLITLIFVTLVTSIVFLFFQYENGSVIRVGGATLPTPLLERLFRDYEVLNSQAIHYQSVGSGVGIDDFLRGKYDFAVSDIYQRDSDSVTSNLIYVPFSIGIVSIAYYLPNNPQIKLTGELISSIFSGQITHWNDKAIQIVNPQVVLPEIRIRVVTRLDESGTESIFRDYLRAVSPGTSPNQFVGDRVNGNQAMQDFIKTQMGAIGFVGLPYAVRDSLSVAWIQNKQGKFIKPSASVASVAANNDMEQLPVSIANSTSRYAYPIVGLSWIVVDKRRDNTQIKPLLLWLLSDGQGYHNQYQFAPLPNRVQKRIKSQIQDI